ncbi:MAG: NYN domain-containing protein [Caldilineales bacterium]|nr:NYN domain-containing protein [Caldilineales bacterium]
MSQPAPLSTTKALKTALYVDFDNIYLGLKQLDEAAAERFATDPARWLAWMGRGMPRQDEEESASLLQPRDILIRRCYLNPRDFGRYRPNFTRSAFSVIDCPPLTAQGKNSADIYMVMDIIDTLEHKTHFDEFIILSGDADFMPVLLRLRSHDRHTAILAAGPASDAYKAACDIVIQEDVFIEYALGMASEAERDEARQRLREAHPTATAEILNDLAARLYAQASANGRILATDLPRFYMSFPGFRDSNWFGFYSLRGLTVDLARRHPGLRLSEGDPWRVTVQTPSRQAPGRRSEAQTRGEGIGEEQLRQRIFQQIRRMVTAAPEPIDLTAAAADIVARLGQQVIDSQWAGAGTLHDLVSDVDDRGFAYAPTPAPGYLYDPKRHEPPQEAPPVEAAPVPRDLADLIRRIHQGTGTPDLSPGQYAVLFEAIADELKENAYNLTQTSKSVRDRCIERGETISRADVGFVLKGIIYKGHRFSKRDSAATLARVFRNSVLARCEDVELDLSEQDKTLIDDWILAGLNGK